MSKITIEILNDFVDIINEHYSEFNLGEKVALLGGTYAKTVKSCYNVLKKDDPKKAREFVDEASEALTQLVKDLTRVSEHYQKMEEKKK